MAKFLFEIGVEELPASFVDEALAALPQLAKSLLVEARLAHGAIRALGTPRRLALSIDDVAERQDDLSEVVTGPPKAAAYDAEGNPRPPAVGFAKKFGVSVQALELVSTDRGEYVAIHRQQDGRAAVDVLRDLMPRLCASIPFRKSMRWGEVEVAFGRPVHWLTSLLGSEVVPVEFARVVATDRTLGHRFLSPEPIEVPHAAQYEDLLRRHHVLVDPDERRAMMVDQLRTAAQEAGGEWVKDDFLVRENATLVEKPHVLCGEFDPSFLELPDEVTIEVMRGHQRYFAVRDRHGALLPRYLAVVNTAEAPLTIARGNDRVLRARLADARFFVDEDLRRPMDERVAELDQVVFQAKLGSLGERVERLEALVAALGGGAAAKKAARLCKADLVTLIVGEFPELQGSMGAWYAARQDLVDTQAHDAIRDHYRPRSASDPVPASEAAAVLAVADRADVLVGCFGIGLIPSGSADPFALRRASLGIVRIALAGPIDVDLRHLLESAYAAYAHQDKPVRSQSDVLGDLEQFFRARLRAWLSDEFPTELIDACLGAWDGTSLRDLVARVDALSEFRSQPAFESLATAFKRAHNITKDAQGGELDPALLTEDAERSLVERFQTVSPRIDAAIGERQYAIALGLVAEQLRDPIDRFFEEVFVMVDDPAVRENRLRLLKRIASQMHSIAHFHVLSGGVGEP